MERIIIKTGDITKENVCAIVNAANSSLLGGGGVDGAIHRAGGSQILEECKKIRQERYPEGLPTGEAIATSAGNLLSSYVIHTVGPIYGQCGEFCDELLASCYRESLKQAVKLGCSEVAFPAISTGIYGYPKDRAAMIAFKEVKDFLDENNDMVVHFVFHNEKDKDIFINIVKQNTQSAD